jgi:flagellar motility protein MotE (MotC chaperone)
VTGTRRHSAAQSEPISVTDGDLGTYSRFKDRLTLMMVALVLALIGFIVQDQVRGKSHDQEATERRLGNIEMDQRQFKDRVNSQFDERLRMLSDHAERLKAVETDIKASREEILRRLDRIEAKLH